MYEEKTPEALKAEILSGLKTDLDRREGSFADDMAGPVAVELYKLYQSLNAVRPMVWVDETSGPYLDLAAEDLGLPPRKDGRKAAAMLEITGTPGHPVPAGTLFGTADGRYFQTLETAWLPRDGAATVPAEAREAGAAHNVGAGTILYQFQSDGRVQSVQNPSPAVGGADPESDAGLYARIVNARQKPATSGNRYDYERWALETEGVGFAKCTPLQNGPGTVGVLIVDEERRPVDDAVVAARAAHIEETRPIGAAVTVQSAGALPVDVAATVRLDGTASGEDVKAAFLAELDAYLKTLAFREYTVRYHRVGALLMGLAGVADYSGLTLCGAAENAAVGENQVPVTGEAAFTWS